VANLLKVPLVVLLSALCAAPAGQLALELGGARLRGRDLVQSFTAGVLSGTLVLAVLAPVVALYTHTSVLVGGRLALGSVLLAIAVATLMFVRHVRRQAPAGGATLLPVMVLVVLLLATLVQLVALASPILPEATPFDGGIDRLLPL
jgi:hypothetical protein